MVFWNKRSLPPQEAVGRANKYLEKARGTQNKQKGFGYCSDAKKTLERIDTSISVKDRLQVVSVYREHGRILETLGFVAEAKVSYGKADELGGDTEVIVTVLPRSASPTPQLPPASGPVDLSPLSETQDSSVSSPKTIAGRDKETVFATIFTKDCPPSTAPGKLPKANERLENTRQLANGLGLLQASTLSEDNLDSLVPWAHDWLKVTKQDEYEQERLETLAKDMVRALVRDELKNQEVIAEVLCLAPVLKKDEFHSLLDLFVNEIEHSTLLDIPALEGLAQLIQGASPGYIDADDLVQILGLLNLRLQKTFQKSAHHVYRLTLTVSRVLDAMVDSKIDGLDRVDLHEPLLLYFKDLKKAGDPYLVFQAVYTYQALLSVPDNEELWKAALRRTGAVIKGVSGLASAVKGLDIGAFIDGLQSIQGGLQGAGQFFGTVMDAYNGVNDLIEGGQGFLESLKSGLSFKQKRDWYPVLRAADASARNGQLVQFKALVWDAHCRYDPAFQWGLCQRLRFLAVAPYLDVESQNDAVAFLGEIYCNDENWGQEPIIKQCILDIVLQLASTSDPTVPGSMSYTATALLRELEHDGDATKRALYRTSTKSGPSSHSWSIALPPPNVSTTLIDRVQNKPSVKLELRKYEQRRMEFQEKRRGHAVYIDPQAKASRKSPDTELFDLTSEKVDEFLKSDKKVFLILGDSGAGKSTFNLELEFSLWGDYKNHKKWIPIFVSLPEIREPERDIIPKQLRRYVNLKDEQLQELKDNYEFILICDGYDECQWGINLYNGNRLNDSGEWKAKMIISCRSESLVPNYRIFFQPGDRNNRASAGHLQEAVIVPFSTAKIENYIQRYVKKNAATNDSIWSFKEYKRTIEGIPNLLELVTNPFLLSLALEVLPRLVGLQDLVLTNVTRVTLYDLFLEQWVDRGQVRLVERTPTLNQDDQKVCRTLTKANFSQLAIDLVKDLAVAIYCNQDGKPVVDFSPIKDTNNWKSKFFDDDNGKNFLREATPLVCTDNKYRFIHKSVLEYGVARAVFEPSNEGDTQSFVEQWNECQESELESLATMESISVLFRKNFVHQPSIIGFLADRVHHSEEFKNQLHDIITLSKTDQRVSQAAANAITILIRSGERFNGEDLRGIRVPGADLSYGDFDSALLQGADLRNTILRNAWLHRADLSNSQMGGATFGEYPHLELEDRVRDFTYSPDGKRLTVGLANDTISMYDTSTWNKISFPTDHQIASGSDDKTVRLWDAQADAPVTSISNVTSMAYSPDGLQMASVCDEDHTVRLWNGQTGVLVFTLEGHTDRVTSITFSPSGNHLASGSWDRTVRLWDAQTGALVSFLDGADGVFTSVVYSPCGHRIATGSSDKTVRLWDAHTGALISTLSGNTKTVSSVVYSPSGNQIASGGWDYTVRLWDAQTGTPTFSLSGHTSVVASVAYSASGHQIASGSSDETVRLWDAQTGAPISSFSGHAGSVTFVLFSPSGQIVSGSNDKTVRLWDPHTDFPAFSTNGHSGNVTSVAYSHSGHQVASCSWDKTVRLWDAQTGALVSTLNGHTRNVQSVTLSPSGHQIASGSDGTTARLWDAQTGTLTFSLSGHKSGVNSVAYSPSGHQIATGSVDKAIRLWDAQTGALSSTLRGHIVEITSVVYSPSGHQIASGSWDATVRLWDAHTGDFVLALEGHTEAVLSVAYSPSGHQIATGGFDKTVRLWDAETGAPVFLLEDHTNEVNCVEYSPNGRLVASGSLDDTVRLWDISSGQCLFVLGGFHDEPYGIAWKDTREGLYFVVGGRAKSVRTWKLIENENQLQVRLHWRSTPDTLVLLKASIQGVQDISDMNLRLLQQRGARGLPIAL
ncbi:hypothetical protein EMPS_02424 [Entomortierella parvispora]|uniref:Arm-like repeat domain-containing protein n=1 Tax=Entomortierella parvispora TaxID=205924 RepID=A0A9P3LTX3_9FUNG|nr:hypothetical protein EMPS_02424 [Entomortierella parvispora]